MRLLLTTLPLAALATAFVIPDQEVMEQIAIESHPQSYLDQLKASASHIWTEVEDAFEQAASTSESLIDSAINKASRVSQDVVGKFECMHSMTAFDAQGWLESGKEYVNHLESHHIVDQLVGTEEKPKHPHHPPHKGHGHHGHCGHHETNQTLYQLLSASKYTTKFTKLINEFPAVVELLNGTTGNFTVFAPTDAAFEKIPDHGKKPAKEILQRVLSYHLSPDFYPAGRVLLSHTIPTSLREEALGNEPQRLRVGLGWGGLKVNFFSKIVAIDIFGANGVIHGVDTLLLPPPPAAKILSILPGQFSTLDYAVEKTGLGEELANIPHVGGTIFAPTNWAFQKLGPGINAFLFSDYGEKYLKALIQYHISLGSTLYSDAFYSAEKSDSDKVHKEGIPQGRFHVDLPTLLEDKSLSIDVARWAGFITIKINGFDSVSIQDGIAKDGVIHAVSSVLIPPKTAGKFDSADEELTVDEFKARFDNYIEEL